MALSLDSFPATESRLQQIRESLKQDDTCKQVMQFCAEGWPKKVTGPVRQYLPVSSELTVQEGLLLRGTRLVIPTSMRPDILHHLHVGHQGITKCRAKAKQSVWWPGLGKQLENVVKFCHTCSKFRSPSTEPMLFTLFPELPWQKVETDLFTWQKDK